MSTAEVTKLSVPGRPRATTAKGCSSRGADMDDFGREAGEEKHGVRDQSRGL